MPLPTGLSRDKSGIFHLRIGVPEDIRPYWPKQSNGRMALDAYRRSLRTQDRTEAITKTHALLAEHQEQFASMRERNRPRLTPLTPKLIAHLKGQIKHELLEADDVRRVIGQVLNAIPVDTSGVYPEELSDAERLHVWAHFVRTQQANGQHTVTKGYVDRILTDMGLPPGDWAHQPAALAVLGRTLAQAYTAIAERSKGELIDTPPAPEPYAPETSAQEALRLAEVPSQMSPKATAVTLRDVVPDWKRLNDSEVNAVQRMNKALSLWEEAVGVVPIAQITRATGGRFVLYLLDQKARKFGDKTASNHASNITALMTVAEKLGIVPQNPLDLSFPVNDSEKRTPWTTEELRKLHGTPVIGDQPAKADAADADLLMSMLLWSGARIGEIAGLRIQDIQERDGILAAYIRLETTKKSKHGTGDVSVRWLPIASAIRQRVADHAKLRQDAGHTSLFPSFNRKIKISPTDQAGRWFLAHREHLGLPTGQLDGSHKWRHTVRTKLAGEGLGEALLDAVTGHQAAGGSAGRKNYTHADMFPLAKVLEAVERLAWPWPSRPAPSA